MGGDYGWDTVGSGFIGAVTKSKPKFQKTKLFDEALHNAISAKSNPNFISKNPFACLVDPDESERGAAKPHLGCKGESYDHEGILQNDVAKACATSRNRVQQRGSGVTCANDGGHSPPCHDHNGCNGPDCEQRCSKSELHVGPNKKNVNR